MLASVCVIPCSSDLTCFSYCPLTNAALTATYIELMMSLDGANIWFYVNLTNAKRIQGSNDKI